MPSTTKIGTIEAVFLIVTIMINHIILNLPKSILKSTGSASIINIIFVSLIMLLIVALICKILKRFPGLDILDISEFLGGKFLKYAIGILFIVYFVCVSAIFIRTLCESLKIIYFPGTPVGFLIILFIIAAIICNRLGSSSIIRSNLIFTPLVLLSILFIFFANIGNLNVQSVFPIFGEGLATTFFSGISNLFAFSGISLLYFIPPHLKETKSFNKVAFSSIILSAIWLLFSVATLLFMFPFVVTTEEILPLYIASRFIEFGRFFQRLDAVFLLIWIISMSSYLNIALSFIVNIFKKISSFKYSNLSIYGFAFLVFIISLIPQNSVQIHFLENVVYKYAVLILLFIISLSVLILASIKLAVNHKRKGDVLID